MVTFKDLPFHVEDKDIFAHLYSQPDIQITKKNIIHAKLRNQQRELTPFLSRGRGFVYIKAGLTMCTSSVVDINHNKFRIFHPSQEKSAEHVCTQGITKTLKYVMHTRKTPTSSPYVL